MPVFIDQTGRSIAIKLFPQRIISLVPSQTELLFDIGLRHEVAGITKFCIHPDEWFRTKTRVGGTKHIKMDTIHQLQPDLIIANKEENVKEQIEELATHYPVWISDVNNLADAYDMIEQIGLITGKQQSAGEIISHIKTNFAELDTQNLKHETCYLIWQNPYMTIGGDTFIHSMLEAAGYKNIYADKTRYPEINITNLQIQKPKFLLLSSEPYPFKQNHIDELQTQLPNTRILLVDGEMFSWYGSRLLLAPSYFDELKRQIK